MRAKLREIKENASTAQAAPIDEQGQYLGTVIKGHFAYFAVPTNTSPALGFPLSHQPRHGSKACGDAVRRHRL